MGANVAVGDGGTEGVIVGGIVVWVGIGEGVNGIIAGMVADTDEPKQPANKNDDNIQRMKILDIVFE